MQIRKNQMMIVQTKKLYKRGKWFMQTEKRITKHLKQR